MMCKDNKWYWHGTVIDITKRKEFEQSQTETSNRYKAFIEISNTGAWEYDVKQDRLWFSDQYLSMIGLDAATYRKAYGEKLQNWIELMHPEDRLKSGDIFRDYFNNDSDQGVYENYFRIKHKNGNWIWIWGRGSKLFNENGEYLWKVIGTHIDITESKTREEQLKESSIKYKIATNYSPDWEYWLLPDKSFEYVSPFCETICGYTADEFMENPNLMVDIIHPEDNYLWSRHESHSDNVSHNKKYENLEFRILHKDGSIRWIKHVCKPVYDENGHYMGRRGTNRDMTSQVNTNLELVKLKKAVENSPVTIVITDTEGNIEYVNPKFTEVTGYSYEEAVGQNPKILKSDSLSQGDYKGLWDTIKSGQTWTGEFKNIKKNGDFYWEYAMIAPIMGENGVISNFVAVKEDISLLKLREKELSDVIAIVTQQNKQLHEFYYILSHNIRSHAANIAAIVHEFREAESYDAYIELTSILGKVSDGLLNTLDNLNENLSIKKDVNIKRENLNLLEYIIETLYINKALIDEFSVDISVSVAVDIDVNFNKAYLQSVLQNLISNAIRYRCSNGIPEVIITAEKKVGNVVLRVADNGLGIDLKLHGSRIFKLGQMFHDHPESRGLGLYIVRNQVAAMGAEITVESTPNVGTTFEINFHG